MVDVSTYVDDKVPFLKVDDVKAMKGDLWDRSCVVTGEAYFKVFKNRDDPTKNDQRLCIPVDLNKKQYILNINKIANARIVEALGNETERWIGARLGLLVAGTGKPYIMVEVLETPRPGLKQVFKEADKGLKGSLGGF